MNQIIAHISIIVLSSGFGQINMLRAVGASDVFIEKNKEMVELLPYLKYYIPDQNTDKSTTPVGISESLFRALPKNTLSLSGNVIWLKFTVDIEKENRPLVLMSRLLNYANIFSIHYKTIDGKWIIKEYDYRTSISDRIMKSSLGAIPIGEELQSGTIFILLDAKLWFNPDWVILTEEGYAFHIKKMSFTLGLYFAIVLMFSTFALLSAFVFRVRLPIFFGLYAIVMGIYILIESNWMSFYLFPTSTYKTFILSPHIFMLLMIVSALYIREVCRTGFIPKWLDKAFLGFLVFTLFYWIITIMFKLSVFGLLISTWLSYVLLILFMIGAYYNFRSQASMRWLLGGFLIMFLAGFAIDLHAQNILYLPWSYYAVVPALTIELIFVAIGTLASAREEHLTHLHTAMKNVELTQDVNRLQVEVNHAQSAYDTFVHRSATGQLNVPKSYYNNPLTAREFQILHLLSEGQTNQNIADSLHLSRNTIKTHLKNLYKKIGEPDRSKVIARAKELGLI